VAELQKVKSLIYKVFSLHYATMPGMPPYKLLFFIFKISKGWQNRPKRQSENKMLNFQVVNTSKFCHPYWQRWQNEKLARISQ